MLIINNHVFRFFFFLNTSCVENLGYPGKGEGNPTKLFTQKCRQLILGTGVTYREASVGFNLGKMCSIA